MLFRHLYDDALAQSSYLIACPQTREAIVVDPLRDVGGYMVLAQHDGLRITAVAETHIAADYCSGARELALRTGATLYLSGCGGPEHQYTYADEAGATVVRERDVIEVGHIRLTVVHTPGHSPEHISFVVTDLSVGKHPVGLLTGDFLFCGDVGRPDLIGAGILDDAAARQGAAQLYRTVRRLAPLPDYLQLWPGHGRGELHARQINGLPQTTLGYERHTNWALRTQSEEEFVAAVLRDPPETPHYYRVVKELNRTGPPMLGGAVEVPTRSAIEAQLWMQRSGFVVDARTTEHFVQGFIPGSLNIPGGYGFPGWFGSLIDYGTDVWLLAEDEQHGVELAHALMRIGFDRVVGVTEAAHALEGAETTTLPARSAVALAGSLGRPGLSLLDVRSRAEYAAGHIAGTVHIPLGELPRRLAEVPVDGTLVTICSNGVRSTVAASLLLMAGAPGVEYLHGGTEAWVSAGYTLATLTA